MYHNTLKISDLIEYQLPNFITAEFPCFVEFYKEYYKSLEADGGVLDVAENFLSVKNIDLLRKNLLVKSVKLVNDITVSDITISVETVVGLQPENGLILIDQEVIFYEKVNPLTNELIGCKRGYSATTRYDVNNTQFQQTEAASHAAGSQVTNLSNLIKFFVLRNYQEQYLSGFPYESVIADIGEDTLIKNIKDFYSYKGTDLSIEFLFRTLFNESVTVRFPKDEVIKTSYSDWTVDDVIKVEALDGNPYDLVGYELFQIDASGNITDRLLVDQILVNNISNYASGNKNIYEIRLNVLDRTNFIIPGDTLLRGALNATSKTVTVDSTIGFPEQNGIIQIDDEYITYRFKSFNQFFDCVRGSYSTTAKSHTNTTRVTTTEYLYGSKADNDEVIKLRLLGVLGTTTIVDGGQYYVDGDKIKLSADGDSDDRPQFTKWLKNETGDLSSSSNNEVNNAVKSFTGDVTSVYKTSKYAYIASTGLPSHPIGPFIGTGFDIRNQYILKSIPLETQINTKVQYTETLPVGIFANGVEALSAKDYESVSYGPIEKVEILQSGNGFDTDLQPIFRIKNPTGSNATFEAEIVNGKVVSISVTDGGEAYTRDEELEVAYGYDATAGVLDTGIANGQIKTINVTNPGNNYIVAPNVEIFDVTGRGKNAFGIAEINSNGEVTQIIVLNGGSDFYDSSNIRVNIVSKGSGVVARAISKKWNFDRVFKINNVPNSTTGVYERSAVNRSDIGNGYLFPSRDAAFGLQYAYCFNPKILRSVLVDNVKGVNANYEEQDTNFVHSPILGWAYDGHPIYGPYGYSDPLDPNSNIARMTSSYVKVTAPATGRPSDTTYPLGSFVDDYEFTLGAGNLDRSNGRFCITPEFPEGTFAYFITVDNFGNPLYPYIVGETFNSVPAQNNLIISHIQSESILPDDARRIRSNNIPSRGFDANLLVSTTERGIIDSFEVYSSGDKFKTSDYLFINNDDTEGAGAYARVTNLQGVTVSGLSYQIDPSTAPSGLTLDSNNRPVLPYPLTITGPQFLDLTKFLVTVTTVEDHLLSKGDQISVIFDRPNFTGEKTIKTRVSEYQTVTYNPPSITTALEADVGFNATTINVTVADDFRVDDYIQINDEILKVIAVNEAFDQLTVERQQFNTKLRLHATTNPVTLYIPEDEPDYRITAGDSFNAAGISATIYQIDKEKNTIELRVVSGTVSDQTQASDTSVPTSRTISIASVTDKQAYWEFDVTNTGNYYRRDLSSENGEFSFVKGTQYKFDLSDGSIFQKTLNFSTDSEKINKLPDVEYVGTPGQAGSYALIKRTSLLRQDVSRVYYFDSDNQVQYSSKYFNCLLLPEATLTVENITDTKSFTFISPRQPEFEDYSGFISYTTVSKSAIGAITEVEVIDGGEGYKKLPVVDGIVHTDLDNATFAFNVTSGIIEDNVSVLLGGRRYDSSTTKIKVVSTNGVGAILTPTIVNGVITSVLVEDGGSGYEDGDQIVAYDTNALVYPTSTSIGKIKTIRFTNYGSQFNPDKTLAKNLIFNKKIIVTNVSGNLYKINEKVTQGQFSGFVKRIQKIGTDSYLIDLEEQLENIELGTLTGTIQGTTATIVSITDPNVIANVTPLITKVGYFDSDLGKLNSSSQKITDSYYYQDFSYVIKSTRSLKEYRDNVYNTTHPTGFKLFGEVSVENDIDFDDTATGLPFSIGLPDDHSDNTVIIQLEPINVESEINFRRYEVSTVNTVVTHKYPGVGAARLNFLDNQIEAVQIADPSSTFSGVRNSYTLTTNDGNFPIGTKNTSIILSLNEIFQEPYETIDVSGLEYDASIATITTTTAHGFASTPSGETYPNNVYVHLENVVPSGNLNFNDKFEIYDVPNSTSIRVLFDNPNGYLTNNDPGVCADVQSTVDNLIGILTYYLNNPSATLPISNDGIWLDPATSTIVSANRHRDAANLIESNKQEIIDRANAQISIDYPDFYYPNDPQTTSRSRYKDAYRLIQQNRQEIIDDSFAEIAIVHPNFINPNSTKCKRDIGYFIDAISLDVHTGGNVYARKFLEQYFNASGSTLISNGLSGEVLESITAFNKARDMMKLAITNRLTVQDLTITADPVTGSNTDPGACANVQSNIDNLVGIVTFYLNQGSLLFPTPLPTETTGTPSAGEEKCKRDLGYIVDAVVYDLKTGGNSKIVEATEFYLDGNGLLANGVAGEVNESVTAFNKARDMMKLALTNQLYEKDFTILPDFLSTSGVFDASYLSTARLVKGQFKYENSNLTLFEAPKEGTTFNSIFYKFVNAADDTRYSYKLKNILFDGVSTSYPLYYPSGSNLVTEEDENLLVFIDGVLQIYGESYTIDRSVNPNLIVFTEIHPKDRHFFAYSFSKYKLLNNLTPLFDGNRKTFDFRYITENVQPPDVHQVLVLLDGVPQVEGITYTVNENIITFTEAPQSDKNCHLLYFYGKTFDKTISIWNGEVFQVLDDNNETTPDGCRYFNKRNKTYQYIQSGDRIMIDGETTKEIISVDQRVLENTDNLVYTAYVYTDNSYIRGKNAVATATVSGVTIPGGNTVVVSGTTTISGTTGVPPVFNYQVTGVTINDPGLEYDVAPIIIFQTNCNNPGKGAEAHATVINGRIDSVTVTNPGSGYTEAPDVIFAKKYEIIKPKSPLHVRKETIVNVPLNEDDVAVISPGFTADSTQVEEEFTIPLVYTDISLTKNIVIEVENQTNRDPARPGLAYTLQTFDQNKFKYEPLNINDPLTAYLGTNVNIENVSRYAPNLTLGDFTTHAGRSVGPSDPAVINYGEESYMAFGFTLPNGAAINDDVIEIDGNLTNVPSSGFIELGNELIDASRISGPTTPGVQAAVNVTAVGYIESVNVSNTGSGYETAPTVTVASPGGTDATITATLTSSGTFKRFDVTNGGSGYTYPPDVTLGGGMTGLSATAEISGGVVTGIVLDGTTYDTTNNNDIFSFGAGTSIAQNGTGTGEQGGFNVGGTHLRFGDSDGGTREVVLEPLDTTGIDTIRIYAIRGNDTNGGEIPEGDSGDESLRIAYQVVATGNPINNNWVDAGIIIWDSSLDGTYGNPSAGLDNYDLSLPAGASGTRVFFKLYQPSNSGTIYDNYGILSVSFLDVNTVYTDSTVTLTNNPLDNGGLGATADVYLNKEVQSLTLSDGGTGYDPATIYNLTFTGGNPTSTAIGTANAKFEFDITVTNPGDGYNTATVTFTGGGGSNLAADLTVDPGTTQITGATITNQGTGYTSIPTYQVSNPDDVWNFNHIRARERGANGTTAFSHPVGKYARLAWRG